MSIDLKPSEAGGDRRMAGLVAAAMLLAFLAAGCATDQTSDLPWNAPQPWEGSPSIPGLSGSGMQ